jgi:amidase
MSTDELLWSGASAQAAALREGSVTAPELLEAVLARLEAVEPQLNAFRRVDAEGARAAARAAQERLDAGERTPLLGVPVAVKDDADVAGDPTGFGGRAQFPPPVADAAFIARLREAGAVLVGRTNVPERCIWPFTETLTRGATRNPWSLDHTPGGSSGGSGAAVAAGVVGLATASDGGGSIRIPAAFCGLLGHKPTRDLVPLDPVEEVWNGLSVYGALSPTVADTAAFLDVCARDGDPAEGPPAGSYRAAVAADPAPLRIALAWRGPAGPSPIERRRRAAVAQTAERLRSLGHEVVERELPIPPAAVPAFLVRFLRGAADDIATLPHPEWLDRRSRGMWRMGRAIPDGVLERATALHARIARDLLAFFDDVDVVLQPSLVGRPWRIGAFQRRGGLTTTLAVALRLPTLPVWNALGYPATSVPVGLDDERLPMAVQLVAPPGEDRRLLALAAQLERQDPWSARRPTAV